MIREKMKRLGITQARLAEEAGVSRRTIVRVLAERPIPENIIEALGRLEDEADKDAVEDALSEATSRSRVGKGVAVSFTLLERNGQWSWRVVATLADGTPRSSSGRHADRASARAALHAVLDSLA